MHFLQSGSKVSPAYVQLTSAAAHRLLLATLGAARRSHHGQDRAAAAPLHSQDTICEALAILGEAQGVKNEFRTEAPGVL